jgi:uncharacterized protein
MMRSDMAKRHTITVCGDLLLLERGNDELIAVNALVPNPLHIKRGRDFVKMFLGSLKSIKTVDKLLQRFPGEQPLLTLLTEHGITSVDNDAVRSKQLCRNDRKCNTGKETIFKSSSCVAHKNKRMNISLYLLLSQSCNMGCIYCLNGKKTYRKTERLKMTEGVAHRAVERYLEELAPQGKLEIVFFGGEPLLNWPLAKSVILHCENALKAKYPDNQFGYHITTNLTILPDDLIVWVKKYKITFLCDIDGPEHIHDLTRPFLNGNGSHAISTHNLECLINAGISVALRSTVTSFNVDNMVEISDHHNELGGSSTAYVPVNPITSDEDILPTALLPEPDKFVKGLVDVFRKGQWSPEEMFPMNTYIQRVLGHERMHIGCGAPAGNTPVVDVSGNVYACIYLVGIEKYFVGNINDAIFPLQETFTNMLKVLDIDTIHECKTCVWRYFCGGGCPIGRLTVSGNPHANKEIIRYTHDIACKTTQAMVETLFWQFADMNDHSD